MTDSNEIPDSRHSQSPETQSVTAIEQRLHVGVSEQETATVRVRTIVHKDLQEIPVVLKRKLVSVERVPANRFVDAVFEPFQDGQTLIVPVFEYVPVTELKLMLKEEIRIVLEETEETSVHRAEVQRQEVVVERRTGTTGDWIAQPAAPSSEDGEQSAF
ncbi:YsnF/AvaK domain-containing protein [Paraburkholderia aromaticivorans]|uniref:YsnF/AvaK domain-containing protein n=1 Tax=Paraburkholderia aromaticivorans TaxID=2026199 RepID=UPI0014560B35|nr:YsnF/AvaK domain-containing protein [Paraburkholderia aromaticivorans]